MDKIENRKHQLHMDRSGFASQLNQLLYSKCLKVYWKTRDQEIADLDKEIARIDEQLKLLEDQLERDRLVRDVVYESTLLLTVVTALLL